MPKTTTRTKVSLADTRPQIDKFKEAARELETNEDEGAFDRALKKVARAPKAPKVSIPEE